MADQNPTFDPPPNYAPDNVKDIVEPVPPIHLDEPTPLQAAPVIAVDDPPRSQPSIEVFPAPPLPPYPPTPTLTLDAPPVPQPAPALSLDVPTPLQPAPPLSVAPSLPAQPMPTITLDPPTPFQPAPALTADVALPAPTSPVAGTTYVPPPLDYSQMIAKIRFTDTLLADALSAIGLNPYSIVPTGPGQGAIDPELYGKWLIDIGKSLGRDGVVKFIATQTALYAMNPETSRVFDPGYFQERAPILNGLTRLTLDTETQTDIANVKEVALLPATEQALAVLDKTGLPMVQAPVDDMGSMNVNGPENTYSDAAIFSVGGLVDAALLDTSTADGRAATEVLARDAHTARFRLARNAFFDDSRVRLGKAQTPHPPLAAKVQGRPPVTRGSSAALARSAFAEGVVPAGFKQDGSDSLVRTRGDAPPSTVIDDDDAYVPLSFTDLRKNGNENRSVFFRPFITSLAESFAPSWEDGAFFGRVDPVVRYQNTVRTITLGFDLIAFSPEDVKVIFQKLHWLTSLVYPEIDGDMLFKSGPVCAMRIGDLIGSFVGGQSGIIRSLDFDYTDALWELKKGMKVPRKVPVSLSFLALHGGPLGLLNGKFGVQSTSDPTLTPGRLRGFGDPEDEVV